VKRKLKGRRFDSIKAIHNAVTAELNAIPAGKFKKMFPAVNASIKAIQNAVTAELNAIPADKFKKMFPAVEGPLPAVY